MKDWQILEFLKTRNNVGRALQGIYNLVYIQDNNNNNNKLRLL